MDIDKKGEEKRNLQENFDRFVLHNKKGEEKTSIGTILVVVLIVLVVAVVLTAMWRFGMLDKLKEVFPNYNSTTPAENLIVDAVIAGHKVKVLLDDGTGRCRVYSTEDEKGKYLLEYGVLKGRLEWKAKSGDEWSDINQQIITSGEVWKKSIYDSFQQKKDNIVVYYNGEKCNAVFNPAIGIYSSLMKFSDSTGEDVLIGKNGAYGYGKKNSAGNFWVLKPSSIDIRNSISRNAEDKWRWQTAPADTEDYTKKVEALRNALSLDENKLNGAELNLIQSFDNVILYVDKNFGGYYYGIGGGNSLELLYTNNLNGEWSKFGYNDNEDKWIYTDLTNTDAKRTWDDRVLKGRIKEDLIEACSSR